MKKALNLADVLKDSQYNYTVHLSTIRVDNATPLIFHADSHIDPNAEILFPMYALTSSTNLKIELPK